MKKIDVLLIARPDHSVQIYEYLTKQNKLSFWFVTFKAMHYRLRSIFRSSKILFLRNNVTISVTATIKNILKYKYRCLWFKRINEETSLDNEVEHLLKTTKCKIVHYWPEYCHLSVEKYKEQLFAIADVHMPNALIIREEMRALYAHYNIPIGNNFLDKAAIGTIKELLNANNIIVPSTYVKDTFKVIFPNKNYYVVPYGITISNNYYIKYLDSITSFVYAGTISIEKGCDILCECFSKLKNYDIHLYGHIPSTQSFIFDKYKVFSNIYFHGSVPKKLLQNEIRNYHVGIHLSRFDAYSLAVGEIIGSGLPVIVSKNTGNADDIIKYNWGLVTSLEMEEVLSNIALITKPNIYNNFCSSIDKYIKTEYVPYGERMVHFYEQIIANL